MSQHVWYVQFWIAAGVIALSPIYVLLVLILIELRTR